MSPARIVAFHTLLRVERGAYASELLLGSSKQLDSRDAGLAWKIVFGSLRYQAQLDYLIEFFSGRQARQLDREVHTALRIGIYQMRYLDRVPTHAAVAESVEQVKRARKSSAAGLVNAILRKVHCEPVPWPDRATELSHPAWLLQRWERQFGREASERIARAYLAEPETYIRIPPGQHSSTTALESTEIPGCFRLLSGDPAGFRIQDISSQAIVPLLELRSGQTFLDLCAAPGNKTAQALELEVRAVACDLNLDRLATLKALGCDLVALDGTQPLPFRKRFDRILVDVPCSGTGTLGRNPEIKWRLQHDDLARFHQTQVMLLANTLEMLRPGGTLVYSTCSLEQEENEHVLEEVLGSLPGKIMRRLPGIEAGDGFFAAVIPST